MTLELTQEQEILRETIREFALSEIEPLASKMDNDCLIPKDLLSKLPKIGLFGISIPPEFSGAGADFLSQMIACEEVAKASGSLGAILSFHNLVVCEALVGTLNSALREDFLHELASGNLGTFCFPALGDIQSGISCRIEGSELIVNGSSKYVMGAHDAKIFVVCGDLGENGKQRILFAFSKENSGSSFSTEERRLMGMRASGTASIAFQELRLPLEALVCEVSKTEEYLAQLQARARLAVASQALGIGQASIDSEVEYANERSQFGAKIGSFYAVQDMIASDAVAVEAARSICYLTSSQIKTSKTLQRDSAIAKIASSNSAVSAARHAIRVHGGYGFTKSYPVERYARDARATQIYNEPNEDLKSLVAGSLL